MKFRSSYFTLVLLAGIGIADAAPKKSDAPMRDIPTHEQLVARQKAGGGSNPFDNRHFKPAEREDPAERAKQRGDLIGSSDFLCSLGKMTLIPKGSVLHMPDRLSDRARPKDNLQIVTWPDFFVKNRSWITTIEVSRLQAEGKQAISEQKMEGLLQTGDVIVATMGGSPISVLPLQIPQEGEESENGEGESTEEGAKTSEPTLQES